MRIQAENGYPDQGVQYVPEQRTGWAETQKTAPSEEEKEGSAATAGSGEAYGGPVAECELSDQGRLAAENSFNRRTFTGGTDIFSRMSSSAASSRSNLGRTQKYDATGDLMAVANAENIAGLQTIHIRLTYKLRMMGVNSESESDEIKSSKRKIKRVISRVKAKLKALKKEAQLEKRADSAEKNRKLKLELELKRELAIRKKNRKNKERNDVEQSRMGLGANYDGILPEDANMQEIEAEIARINMGGGAAAAAFDGGGESLSAASVSAELSAAGMPAGEAAAAVMSE